MIATALIVTGFPFQLSRKQESTAGERKIGDSVMSVNAPFTALMIDAVLKSDSRVGGVFAS
jgi:hypothetical protein